MNNTQINMNLIAKMYVNRLQSKLNDHYKQSYQHVQPPTIRLDFGSKFIKIVTGTSVYAFISLQDFENKGLGKVKQGDLMKPASWNAPTKHARGNIIQDLDTAVNNSGPYGVIYLR